MASSLEQLRIKVVVDGPRLAKLVRKAIAKIEAMPDEQRIDGFAEHAAKIVNECVSFDVLPNLPKDS